MEELNIVCSLFQNQILQFTSLIPRANSTYQFPTQARIPSKSPNQPIIRKALSHHILEACTQPTDYCGVDGIPLFDTEVRSTNGKVLG